MQGGWRRPQSPAHLGGTKSCCRALSNLLHQRACPQLLHHSPQHPLPASRQNHAPGLMFLGTPWVVLPRSQQHEQELIKSCSQALLRAGKPHHTGELENWKTEAGSCGPEVLPVIPKLPYATVWACRLVLLEGVHLNVLFHLCYLKWASSAHLCSSIR